MTFEEILPKLREGKKVIREIHIESWCKLQNCWWYQRSKTGPPILMRLYGNSQLSAEDLEATDWKVWEGS